MSIDLENRLRSYGDVLDAAIEFELIRDIELTAPLADEMVPLSSSASSPRRTALVVVAAAGLLIGGSLALLTDDHSASQIPAAETASESGPGTTILSFPSSTTNPPDDPSLWDPIRVAPGTVGWYEFGDIPASLTSRVGAVESWTNDYTASFYRCATYTVDAEGPICTGLIGGNFVAPTTFAGTGELGTHLGDMTTADLAWALAQGSSLGYADVTSAPPATPVAVGDHAGLMYSNAHTSYLVWEQTPGVHLWIRATDVPTDDMVGLALTVRPAVLPDHLPLPIIVDTVSTSGAPSFDELVIGSHPGMPLCAEINTSNGCVSLPPLTDVAMVVGNNGVDGQISAVAAIFPLGSADRLRVDLADADSVTVEPVVSPLGFQYAIFRPGTERIIGGGTVARDGSVVATVTLSTVPTGPTPTTVGSIVTPDPGRFHPEEGSYILQPGDFPSTIAHNFKVSFQALLDINGWTIVNQVVPEFPPAGTTIKIPPGWTEPGATTGNTTTTT